MSASGCVFSWPALPALVYTPRRCRRVEYVWGPMSAGSLRDAPLLVLYACAAHGALASVVGTQPLCRGGLYTIYSLHAWSTKAGRGGSSSDDIRRGLHFVIFNSLSTLRTLECRDSGYRLTSDVLYWWWYCTYVLCVMR